MCFILSQLDHWDQLLEILLHCHILDMVAQGLVEVHGFMEKVQYSIGFLVPCVPISLASQFPFMNDFHIVYLVNCLTPSILSREFSFILIPVFNCASCPMYCCWKPLVPTSLFSKLNSN